MKTFEPDDSRCLVIGEVAQAHDGSLGLAHAYIDAIANANADAVKFQTHIAAAESSLEEEWRVKFSPQDETRFDYWKRMEFTEGQWRELCTHAEDRDLLFLSSPFSLEAVRLLNRIGVAAWKIASGEINNVSMFEEMACSGLPILLSTGMSPLAEIDAAVERVKARSLSLTLMQCTSAYPCPPEQVGLNLIPFFSERYGCSVGLSDHSGKIYTGLAASTLGIAALEVHVTLSREMYGPDVSASVTTRELRNLVEGVRFIENMRNNPLDKDAISENTKSLRRLFMKSIVATTDLPAGTILRKGHLGLRKPGTGLPPPRLNDLIGGRLTRDLKAREFLREQDVEARR